MEPVAVQHTGLECPFCLEHIYSKYRHDFKHCGCGYCFVDGGLDYMRYGWGVYYEEDPKQTKLVNETIGKPQMVRMMGVLK